MRQALEIALYVAARADDYDPPVEPPRYLRPFSNFRKPVKAALSAAYRALEEDEEFRRRVAEDLEVADVGRVSWLFLHRPEGWEEEIESAEAELAQRRDQEQQALEEQRATRRLREVGAEVERLRRELAEARSALAVERDQRASAARKEAELRAELTAAQRERDDALERSRLAEERSLSAESRAADLRAEADAARGALERQNRVDLDALRRNLAGAARALTEASTAIEAGLAAVPPEQSEATKPPARKRRPIAPKREPARLPGGVLDDSPEAAEHLVRLPSAVLIVDGYNASRWAWDGLTIADQRDRLISALCELHARTGISIQAVFDGDGDAQTDASPTTLVPVRVIFSAREVEADDVVISRVSALPRESAVVVASNDNRVREACAAAGANLLTIAQLMGVLGR